MSVITLVNKNTQVVIEKYSDVLEGFNEDTKQGAGFMLYSLQSIFKNFSFEEVEEGIVDSSYRKENHDYGIDAIYVTANNDFVNSPDELDEYNADTKFVFHLLQFKKGRGVELSDVLKLKEGIQRVFIDEECEEKKNGYLFNKLIQLNELKMSLYNKFSSGQISVKYYLVFGGLKSTVDANDLVIRQLDIIQKTLHDNGYTNANYLIVDAQRLLDLAKEEEDIVDVVEYLKTFKYITETSQNKKLNGYITIVNATQIANLVKKWQTSLFEANIRDFYRKSDINKKIVATSASKDEAKYFWSFNNGLTLTCRQVEELPNDKYRLHGLQIVNGCQTSNALYIAAHNAQRTNELLEKQKHHPLSKKEAQELEETSNTQLNEHATILTKIIETNDPDLIYRITETTNSQTPIKTFSLKANENIQQNIEQFLLKHDIYYERRVNFYKNKGKKNIVSIQKLFQLFVAQILLMPSQIKTHPKKLFTQYYDEVFPDTQSNYQFEYFLYLLPILIDEKIQKFNRKLDRAEDPKDAYNKALLAYAKLHIGPLIIHSIIGNYSKATLIKKEKQILKVISDDKKLDAHIEDALGNLKKVIQALVGVRKQSIYPASRKSELDDRIVRFINSNS
jgi:hypothetical protein